MIFLLPETMYDRPAALNTDVGHGAKEAAAFEKAEHELTEKSSEHQTEDVEASSGAHYLPAKTFLQEMKPWSGYVRECTRLTFVSAELTASQTRNRSFASSSVLSLSFCRPRSSGDSSHVSSCYAGALQGRKLTLPRRRNRLAPTRSRLGDQLPRLL